MLRAGAGVRSRPGQPVNRPRLAGLVGPSRHPGRWLAGKTGLPGGNAPVNLVHQDDVIGILLRVLENNMLGDVFDVCANERP